MGVPVGRGADMTPSLNTADAASGARTWVASCTGSMGGALSGAAPVAVPGRESSGIPRCLRCSDDVSCRLGQEVRADEGVELPVEDALGVPLLDVRAMVLDELVGGADVGSDLAAEARG